MFSIRNKKNDAANVVQEKAIEPRTERSLAFRIEALEQRIAPAQVDYFAKVDYF